MSWSLSVDFVDVARGLWWPVIGGYHVGTTGEYLFNNVSFVSYIITLMPSVNGSAELPVTVSELGHVGILFKRVGFKYI